MESKQLWAESVSDHTAIFDTLGLALDQASQKGYLPDPGLAIEDPEDTNLASSRSYILTLVSRLIDLGYLRDAPKNRSKSKLDPYIKNALRNFQEDAGLVADKYAGPVTWNCLQQLVSFEEEQDPYTWQLFSTENSLSFDSPALIRAVYLRLYVLGFFEWPEKLTHKTDISMSTNFKFKQAMDDFLDVAWQLGLTQTRLNPEITHETIKPLFSQDILIQGIASHPNVIDAPENRRFLEAIARIELWLVGFEVNIGNPLIRLKKRQSNNKKQKSTGLAPALEEFWAQQPKDKKPKVADQKKISSAFFSRLVQLEDEVDDKPETYERDIVEQVCLLKSSQKKDLMVKIKEVASSIWDGIKRVTRWIVKGIKNFFSKASTMMKNLARYIAKRARVHFPTVRKAFEIVYRGVVYFKQQVFTPSRPKHLIIYHDKDFDTQALSNPLGNTKATEGILKQLRIESRCFKAACKILGHLAAIFKGVVLRLAAGAAGWFSILLALTRLGKRLTAIAREIKEVLALEVELSQSPFSNPVV